AEGQHDATDNQAPHGDNRNDDAQNAAPAALFLYLFRRGVSDRFWIWQVPGIGCRRQWIPGGWGGAALGEGVAIDRLEHRQVNVLVLCDWLRCGKQTCGRVRTAFVQ